MKLYLLDENRDNVKRDFFMGMKTGTDVIYITPPVRSEHAKVYCTKFAIQKVQRHH